MTSFRYFCFHLKNFVQSRITMFRLSCVLATYVQTFVLSKLPMSSLSCGQKELIPYHRAFKFAYVKTIVRSFVFPDRVTLNAEHPPCAFFTFRRIELWSGTLDWVRKSAICPTIWKMRTKEKLCELV